MRLGRIELVAPHLRSSLPKGALPLWRSLTLVRSLLPQKRGGHRFSPTPPSVRFYDYSYAPGPNRTANLLLRRQLLYPIELQAHSILSGRADLNRRPLGPKPSALAKLSHSPLSQNSFAEFLIISTAYPLLNVFLDNFLCFF